MDGLLVILALVVVPSAVAAAVVALVARIGRGGHEHQAGASADGAVRAAVEHLVAVNRDAMAGERQRDAVELDHRKALIDQEVAEMRGDLRALTALVEDVERERRRNAGALGSQLAEAGRSTRELAATTQSLREALSSTNARG